jgi:hypothetical protein
MRSGVNCDQKGKIVKMVVEGTVLFILVYKLFLVSST